MSNNLNKDILYKKLGCDKLFNMNKIYKNIVKKNIYIQFYESIQLIIIITEGVPLMG